MKPRLRMRRGVWCCSLIDGRFTVPPVGHGYNPREAFAEWQHLFALCGGHA